MMSGLSIEEDEILVSLDVSFLFTNVPIDEAVQIIHDRLRNDEMLCDRTTLIPDRVAELLEVCLTLHKNWNFLSWIVYRKGTGNVSLTFPLHVLH